MVFKALQNLNPTYLEKWMLSTLWRDPLTSPLLVTFVVVYRGMPWSPEESHSTISPSALLHPSPSCWKGALTSVILHCILCKVERIWVQYLLPRVNFEFNWGHAQGGVSTIENVLNRWLAVIFIIILFSPLCPPWKMVFPVLPLDSFMIWFLSLVMRLPF